MYNIYTHNFLTCLFCLRVLSRTIILDNWRHQRIHLFFRMPLRCRELKKQKQKHLALSMDHAKIFASVKSQGSNFTLSQVFWKFYVVTLDDSFLLKNLLGHVFGCQYIYSVNFTAQVYLQRQKTWLCPQSCRGAQQPTLPLAAEWLLHYQSEELRMPRAEDLIGWNNHSFLCYSGNGP